MQNPVGAAEGRDLLILLVKNKIKRSQPPAAPTGNQCQPITGRWQTQTNPGAIRGLSFLATPLSIAAFFGGFD
jgi:hypothetical protein